MKMPETHRTPGFEANLEAARDFLNSIKADGLPSKGCPVCGCTEEPGLCSGCGLLMCPRCELDPDMHVRCLPPECMVPYRMLQDCQNAFLLIKRAYHHTAYHDMFEIADNMDQELQRKAIR